MTTVERVTDSFYNIRDKKKMMKVMNVGTHASLCRRSNGKWIMLDAVDFTDSDAKHEVNKLTNGGDDLEAIINLHPYHSENCKTVHIAFPKAKLYGCRRHRSELNDLPWESGTLEDRHTRDLFKDDLDLRIPDGLKFEDESHASSVVAFHRDSHTMHADDTFNVVELPKAAKMIMLKGKKGDIQLSPKIGDALEDDPKAARKFKRWVKDLCRDWDIHNLVTAHKGSILKADMHEKNEHSINEMIRNTLDENAKVFKKHEEKYTKQTSSSSSSDEASRKAREGHGGVVHREKEHVHHHHLEGQGHEHHRSSGEKVVVQPVIPVVPVEKKD